MDTSNEASLSWAYELYQMAQLVTGDNSDVVQRNILEHIVTGFGAETGSLALADEKGETLTIVAGIGLPKEAIGNQVPFGKGIMGTVASKAWPLLLNGDLSKNPNLKSAMPPREGERPRSAMCWPLKSGQQVFGVMTINRGGSSPAFTDDDLERGGVMVNLVSLAVANAKLQDDQQRRIRELSDINCKLEEAQNQLLQSEKMASVGQLAAGVAHEINNPVGYVYSNVGTLGKELKNLFRMLDLYESAETHLADHKDVLDGIRILKDELDLEFLKEDLADLLKESQEGLNRVKQIVQDLKDFSHVDESEWQWVHLHRGIDSTLNVVHNELKYKARIQKEYGDLPQVKCLGSQVNQVFMNLLVNAAQAMKEPGTITIRTGATDDDWVWASVSDTGAGIPPENVKRLFEPFFTTKPVGKGTGLGLSLAYSIIDKHGGRIEVDSEVGKGTTFTIWLPVDQVEQQEGEAA